MTAPVHRFLADNLADLPDPDTAFAGMDPSANLEIDVCTSPLIESDIYVHPHFRAIGVPEDAYVRVTLEPGKEPQL